MNSEGTTFDVPVWGVSKRTWASGAVTYRVRWIVAGHTWHDSFKTRALADSFRSELLSLARKGEPFDAATGQPLSRLRLEPADQQSWYAHACAYVDMKWPQRRGRVVRASRSRWRRSPRRCSRRSGAGLRRRACGRSCTAGRPTLGVVRRARRRRVCCVRSAGSRRARGRSPTWLTRRCCAGVGRAGVAHGRQARVGIDGEQKAGDLLQRLGVRGGARAPVRQPDCVDQVAGTEGHRALNPRVVINHGQARALLAAVRQLGSGPRLVAFFGVMYYSALRPGEAVELRKEALSIPERGRGELYLSTSAPSTGRSWSDSRARRDPRQLKHRGAEEVRIVPCPPELTVLLREHLDEYGTSPDGRLFRGARGGPLSESLYGRLRGEARVKALRAAEVASPLARRPYDLRHAAVSTWLNSGVPAPQVAAWAGHSVNVLLRVYAKCIAGQEGAARRRIEEALRGTDS